MANTSKVPETVKVLKGFKSPDALAEALSIKPAAARARIEAVKAAGYKLETREGTRNGSRGRNPTEYRVTGKPAA